MYCKLWWDNCLFTFLDRNNNHNDDNNHKGIKLSLAMVAALCGYRCISMATALPASLCHWIANADAQKLSPRIGIETPCRWPNTSSVRQSLRHLNEPSKSAHKSSQQSVVIMANKGRWCGFATRECSAKILGIDKITNKFETIFWTYFKVNRGKIDNNTWSNKPLLL